MTIPPMAGIHNGTEKKHHKKTSPQLPFGSLMAGNSNLSHRDEEMEPSTIQDVIQPRCAAVLLSPDRNPDIPPAMTKGRATKTATKNLLIDLNHGPCRSSQTMGTLSWCGVPCGKGTSLLTRPSKLPPFSLASSMSGLCTRYMVGNSGLRRDATIFTTDMRKYGTTERPKASYPYRSICCGDRQLFYAVLRFVLLVGAHSGISAYVAPGAVDGDTPCHRLD